MSRRPLEQASWKARPKLVEASGPVRSEDPKSISLNTV